jgi:hypothetical protein
MDNAGAGIDYGLGMSNVDTIEEARDYAMRMFRRAAGANDQIYLITALQVLVNTIAKEIRRLDDAS